MKVVRGDFLHNYLNCDDSEAAQLVYDELVKAFMLFRRAANDILKSEGLNAEELAMRASEGVNAEQAVKLTKLLFLVNMRGKNGAFELHGQKDNWSVRHLFSHYGSYFDDYQQDIKHISHDVHQLLLDSNAAVSMTAHLYDYAAFGGSDEPIHSPTTGFSGLLLLGFLGLTAYALTRQ